MVNDGLEIVRKRVQVELDYVAIDSPVERTPGGLPYLRRPGAILVTQPATSLVMMRPFLEGISPEFGAYVDDPVQVDGGTAVAKVMGQLCYLSFAQARTLNRDAAKYFDRIKSEKHGSVVEHANYSIILYGIDRAGTHELVRHRVGTAFSQVSQRYVGPEVLRYVMPLELQGHPEAEAMWFAQAERTRADFIARIELLAQKLPSLPDEAARDKRKRVQSFARRALPNEAEAPIGMTGNCRLWRHVFTKRLAPAADVGIRRSMWNAFRLLREVNQTAFSDFEPRQLSDGSWSAVPQHEGV